jgi:PhzF family phenazine biosynthesis protein
VDVPLVQIDAFAECPLEGNPAAVMPLADWLDDTVMQRVALENNLSETAFVVDRLPADAPAAPDPSHPTYHLRWFTPAVEVDLCGHATLATAAYLFEDVHRTASTLQFWTRSGWLPVTREPDGAYTMDFPTDEPRPDDVDPVVATALGVPVDAALRGRSDLVYVLPDAASVAGLTPAVTALGRLPVRGVAVTAPGDGGEVDFVSRWFGARAGVAEDPVTGSAHCTLAPYWAARLGKPDLVARQVSARGGTVRCRVRGDRTLLTGRCARFLTGTATLPG